MQSYDWYSYDGPHYQTCPCKRIQQNLHLWGHTWIDVKWAYNKDPNSSWAHFQTALNNLPSEKIVDLHYAFYRTGGVHQIWAYIKRHN